MPYKSSHKRKKYHRSYMLRWRDKNPEKWKLIQQRFEKKHKEKRHAYHVKINRRRYHVLKAITIQKYGGKCNCCGEKDIRFLTIDHVKNNGKFERKKLNNYVGKIFGYLAKSRKKPAQYQILCWNCNMGKYHYNICPHKNEFLLQEPRAL